MRKSVFKFVLLLNVFLSIILIVLFLWYLMHSSIEDMSKEFSVQSQEIADNFNTHTFKTASGTTLVMESPEFEVHPGHTYFLDKGNLKLYADVYVMGEDAQFRVFGKQYHMGKEMTDAAIDDTFTYDIESDDYVNSLKTLSFHYDGETITFNDHRKVALQFAGVLTLISEELDGDAGQQYDTGVQSLSSSLLDEVSENTSISTTKVTGLVSNEFSETASVTGIKADSSFESTLTSSNERQQFTITAKYLGSASNSGTKYQEVNSGIEFYAFGQSYPYESSECNVVTITCVYRGNEEHFNGLSMGEKYPCFVINSIRHCTKEEIGQ